MSDQPFDLPHFAPADAACRELTLGVGRQAMNLALTLADAEQRAATLDMMISHEIAAAHCEAFRCLHETTRFHERPYFTAARDLEQTRASQEAVRFGNLAARLFDRVTRAALALHRLNDPTGRGGKYVFTWARPDWLDQFPDSGIGRDEPEPAPGPANDNPPTEKPASSESSLPLREGGRGRGTLDPSSNAAKLHATPGQRRGRLKNGNPAGDYLAAPRCGARTRQHTCCRQPAMTNGRCRLHGGRSTGARTADGLKRVQTARLTHGYRTAEIIQFRKEAVARARRLAQLTKAANDIRIVGAPPRGRPGGHMGPPLQESFSAGHGLDRSVSPIPLDPRPSQQRG